MWLLSQSAYGGYQLTEFSDHALVPPYAILSHTWLHVGKDESAAEATFRDLREGLGQQKPGYQKIQFCGEQARRDGLEYFWVDTCCINKGNYNELSYGIHSIFGWYRNSDRCYVYLSDVSGSEHSVISRSWNSELQEQMVHPRLDTSGTYIILMTKAACFPSPSQSCG